MARNMFVFVSGTGSTEAGAIMDGSAGGLMFMVGMIVISVAVMSMIIFGCADCADGNNQQHYGGGAVAASAAAASAGGGGSACGGGGGGC